MLLQCLTAFSVNSRRDFIYIHKHRSKSFYQSVYPTKYLKMDFAEQDVRHVSWKIILRLTRIPTTRKYSHVMAAQPTAFRGKSSRLDLRGFSPKILYLALYR